MDHYFEEVVIFHGSFNPFTYGHGRVVTDILKAKLRALVLITPAHNNNCIRKPSLTTSHTQRAMMIYAFYNNNLPHNVRVDTTRADLPGRISPLKYYYMVQERFSNAKIYCAKGTDNIIKLLNGNIYLPDECKARKQLPFLVMDRPPYVLDNVDLPPNFEVIRQSDDRVMSSTALRKARLKNQPLGYWCPPQLEQYVYDHNLFTTQQPSTLLVFTDPKHAVMFFMLTISDFVRQLLIVYFYEHLSVTNRECI